VLVVLALALNGLESLLAELVEEELKQLRPLTEAMLL
jgi:hypothetical protein